MFNYDFMQNAFFVAICISLLCPCIGIFMVLRRSSMIGDTMSHASLAGITLVSSGKLKANANVFFFGSILTVNTTDMISIAVLTILSVLTLYFLYNSLLYIAYDEEAARVAGVKVDLINYVFAILMAAAVSISIKIVGVLVLSAMIALPVASALQLEKGFKTTLLCSIGFSLLAMIIGLFGSYYLNVAPGGFVSLTSVFILLVVLIIKNIKSIIRRIQFSK